MIEVKIKNERSKILSIPYALLFKIIMLLSINNQIEQINAGINTNVCKNLGIFLCLALQKKIEKLSIGIVVKHIERKDNLAKINAQFPDG